MKRAVVLSSLLLVTGLSFALEPGTMNSARTAAQPKDLRGVYVVVLNYPYSSPQGLAAQAALKVPGTDGMTLVCLWNALESSPGQFTWQTMDRWIALADSLGKKITLVVRAGSGIPAWLFQSSAGRAAAAPMNFRVSPHDGKTGVCDTETIAAPWDPAFLARWDTLLVALSAHLKLAGTYGAVTALRLTGINRTSDELRLPAETAQSSGLSCVSDAISAWSGAGYTPSKLLQAWDAVTGSFLNTFPDKSFCVAIIPNPPQIPFPPIAEDGSVITDTLPDQNIPLLQLASQKFPGRLVVQFNFLFPGTPANIAVIQSAQTLGTMAAFQTNNFYSLSDSGAACGGTPAHPAPCADSTYMAMLETGIYPLGKSFSLRSTYIEVWPINANAFPDAVLKAHSELLSSPLPPSVSITLGAASQVFHAGKPDAMGMTAVPDMHTTFIQQPDSSYRIWIAGRFNADSVEGATGVIATKDFLSYTPVGSANVAQVVLPPSCRPGSVACWNNFDADYAGADLVYRAANGKDLLMLYHGQTKYYGVRPPNRSTDPSWCEIGLARSTDSGITWSGRASVVSGSDPKPDTIPAAGIYGTVEPGAIIANGYVYAYYAYFPTPLAADDGPPTIQVARSLLSADAAPGSWTKYYSGSFGVQPGLGGLGSQVVPTVSGATRYAQPWPVFSTYLNAYVLLFICSEGWFFSVSTDLVNWSVPEQFFTAPVTEFTQGKQTDENVIMVTPGNPAQVIGQSGYVLYAHTPAWGDTAHELWVRPFTFNATITGVRQAPPASPERYALEQNYPNPFNPATTIRYSLPGRTHVTLTVFNELGQIVTTLVREFQEGGYHEVRFNANNLASGVYFYRLLAGDYAEVKKLLLIK